MKKLITGYLFLCFVMVSLFCTACSREPSSGREALSPAPDKLTDEEIYQVDEANRIERKALENLHTGDSREDMIRCLGYPNRWDGKLIAYYDCTNGEYVWVAFGWKMSEDGEGYEYEVEEINVRVESPRGNEWIAPTPSVFPETDIFRTDKGNRIEWGDITEVRIGEKQEEVFCQLGFPNEGGTVGKYISQYHCADEEYVLIWYQWQTAGEWEGYAVDGISLRGQPYELRLSMAEEDLHPVDEENRIERKAVAELHTGATQEEVFETLGLPNQWIHKTSVEYLCTNGERVELRFRWEISEDWEGYQMTTLLVRAQPPKSGETYPTPDIGPVTGTLTKEERLREDKTNRVEWENTEDILIGATQGEVIRQLGYPNNAEENCAQYYTVNGEYIVIYYKQCQKGEWEGNVVLDMVLSSQPYLVK